MIVTARPPKRTPKRRKPTPIPCRIVQAKTPAQIKRAKRIERLRERGY